jgi:hypothetical protein
VTYSKYRKKRSRSDYLFWPFLVVVVTVAACRPAACPPVTEGVILGSDASGVETDNAVARSHLEAKIKQLEGELDSVTTQLVYVKVERDKLRRELRVFTQRSQQPASSE